MIPPFTGVVSLEFVSVGYNIAALSAFGERRTKLRDHGVAVLLDRVWVLQPLNEKLVKQWLDLDRRPELIDFADRGVAIFRDMPDTPIAVLSWGMAIATYPFFGRVAEIVGRLTALQGDCASSEVHRRMTEIYGEREGTLRMTNMVLQSQASWGGIRRTEDGKRLIREPPTVLFESKCAAWLIEACVRYLGRPIAVSAVDSLPVKYPFSLSCTATMAVAASASLELRTESSSTLLVSLREGRLF